MCNHSPPLHAGFATAQYAPMEEAWAELSISVLPSGHVMLTEGGQRLAAPVAARVAKAFAAGAPEGLVQLATTELQSALPAELAYLRDFARGYLTQLCHASPAEAGDLPPLPPPAQEELTFIAMRCPPLPGAEYLNASVLAEWWVTLDAHVRELAGRNPGGIAEFLAQRSPLWRTVGRVTFHLAENKRDPDRPFAFMATYTSRLSAAGRPQHLPLARALQEYAGAGNREGLLKLLVPVDQASQRSAFVKSLVETGTLYRPTAWSAADAFRFLRDVPAMEEAGLVVRVPDLWKARRPSRPMVSATIGEKRKSAIGLEALVDFDLSVTIDGQALSPQEIEEILSQQTGLVRIRDQWVELDRDKLQAALEHWKAVQREAAQNGISFQDALRLLSGAQVQNPDTTAQVDPQWVGLSAGQWLGDVLKGLRNPQQTEDAQHPALNAQLRPYQKAGVNWLRFISEIGLGACLADDMGLGKTIQVITLLLHLKDKSPHGTPCSLLVVPASLIGNWTSELARFAPSLRALVLHSSGLTPEQQAKLAANPAETLTDADLVITTYGMLMRTPWLTDIRWRLAILDEAQAIKNGSTRQARAATRLQSVARIAMTGTPVENRLGDLWSLFNFLNPGLLGNAKTFANYTKGLTSGERPDFRPLRLLIKPYILRRLKTDKTIISDLPDKTELKAWCGLAKAQAKLYQQTLVDLESQLQIATGIQRRGMILATLLRLKQICNHPSQWTGDGEYAEANSGKFARLRELCEELAQRQQKVLIFTQFREVTEPLAEYLQGIFGRPGLVLHGGTDIPQRKKLVDEFQREDGPPFFVLSIKAGGTGLNLTAASTVIHFDRWWNPAVENQATDRAFRIGQKSNVLVHKFVCRGTVEEKIDALIEEKTGLSREVLEGGGERLLTEMNDRDLMQFLSLDLQKAMEN